MSDFTETRSMLIALLQDMPLGPLHPVVGLDEMETEDKLFLIGTCCSETIAELVWLMADGNKTAALKVASILFDDIKDNINMRSEHV